MQAVVAPYIVGGYYPHYPPYTLSWIGPTNKAEMVCLEENAICWHAGNQKK